ncbi:MAG TPA: hypothetical protein VEG35_06165 [Burkholderiales bacterium]|nr:hypothetical protein [Burkholderiales bacterium]
MPDKKILSAMVLALAGLLVCLGRGAGPAGAVRSVRPSPPAQANDAIDGALAAALIEVHDTLSRAQLATRGVYQMTKSEELDSSLFYDLQPGVDGAVGELARQRPDDPLRQKLVQATGQLLAGERAALENAINCAVLNKDTSGRSAAQAEDFAKRAIAALNGVTDQVLALGPDFRVLADASPSFLKALPVEMRYFLGLAERKSRLLLGADVMARNPFLLVVVGDRTLAGRLGLRSGDRIIAVGGRRFTADDDVEDFKLAVEANLGRTLKVLVDRRGKMKTLSLKVPAEIAPEFLRAQGAFPWL